MMEEKKLSLQEIHEELLCQMRDITAICERHGIEYNMMCGSLLGAVRHKGFIPWDDDIDLLITRENFEKFRKIYPKECDKRFEMTYLNTWTPRVMNRDPEKAAAFTDFFILDSVPAQGLKRKWWFLKLHILQTAYLCNLHICAVHSQVVKSFSNNAEAQQSYPHPNFLRLISILRKQMLSQGKHLLFLRKQYIIYPLKLQ